MAELNYLKLDQALVLESGRELSNVVIAYHTFGKLNENKSNVIWIIHALTANANPLEWWPGLVGEGSVIDPAEYFIVCANVLGSHYGSTCALHENPRTGKPYYHDFPMLTIRDLIKPYETLADHLGLEKIKLLIGASLGGQQAMEWAIKNPLKFEKLALLATNANHSPWGIAFNESQRMAIEADQSWYKNYPDAGIEGLKAARSIALLSYRTIDGYNITQKEETPKVESFKASSYQRYQGQKLADRFNAFSYHLFTKCMDSHDVGRGRTSREEALSRIKAKTTIIGIESDILFPVSEQAYLHECIKDSKFYKISSKFGHDGFLVEKEQVGNIIRETLDN
ncbi:MAG TPA: homoserine O-acetyltransferase [Saprospiraceae bacterium]|nr:homoserine O-acetyltransferase [Saprospiraceae bacterium]HPN70863.1 homoserine O-acetyltransferase [Saprospiraceae bacterium]